MFFKLEPRVLRRVPARRPTRMVYWKQVNDVFYKSSERGGTL